METVLIAGGSGTIGKYLSKKLIENGFNVNLLSRTNKSINGITTYLWNVENQYLDEKAIESADYIINLSGANIGEKKWSSKRKKEINDSRVNSTKLLFNKVEKQNKKLKAFISASAVGFYGMTTSDKIYAENDLPASDFLGLVCNNWENSCNSFEKMGIRTVKIRTGVVLNSGKGALSKMKLPIKMLIGSALGTGNQFIPWIHIEDLCNIYLKAVTDKNMNGVYNAVAPEHISNREFTQILAGMLKKPIILPNLQAFVLKVILGEMAKIVLEGSRISSKKIANLGFHFKYPTLNSALKQIILNK